MSRTADLHDGETLPFRFLVIKAEEAESKNGKTYVKTVMVNKEDKIDLNIFDKTLSSFPFLGKVVDIMLTKNGQYYNLHGDINLVYGADMSEFIPEEPIDTDRVVREFRNSIQGMSEHPIVQQITNKIFEDNIDKFVEWTAAKSMHHNRKKGLAYHEYRMLRAAKSLAFIYELNNVYIEAGVILHDIAKIRELSMDEFGNVDYTVEGDLLGHIYIGAEMIQDACHELGIDPKEEDVLILKHMILSHHGKLEFGAVKFPATKEAYALSMIDDFDSKIWKYESIMGEMEAGTVSNMGKGRDMPSVYKYND